MEAALLIVLARTEVETVVRERHSSDGSDDVADDCSLYRIDESNYDHMMSYDEDEEQLAAPDVDYGDCSCCSLHLVVIMCHDVREMHSSDDGTGHVAAAAAAAAAVDDEEHLAASVSPLHW